MSAEDSPVTLALHAAAELKAAAAELGNESPQSRRQQFAQILEQAEKQLSPNDRPEFYRSLARWFSDAEADEQPDSGQSNGQDLSSHSTDELVNALKSKLESLGPKEKAVLLNRLSELVPRSSGAATAAPPGGATVFVAPETLRMLGVPPNTPVEVSRIAPLFGLLVEVLVHLDDSAWDVWASFGNDGKGLRREVVMRKALAHMLMGKSALTVLQMQLQIAILQRLTVELLAQMNRVGEYAMKKLHVVSPNGMQREVEAQRGGWSLASVAARCWERYGELWPELEGSMQHAVNKDIAKRVSEAVNGQRF